MKRNRNLTFKVYKKIKDLMLNYEIVPGQRLVFVDLARRLKVSRTPVNNALSILAREGYLDFVPNQGYSVHRLTRAEAEELYQIRDVLEMGFISKAIQNVTPQSLRNIENVMYRYENAITNRVQRNLFIIDTEFHLSILAMAGNMTLLERYKIICQKIFLRMNIEGLLVERIREIIGEHDRLYTAVCNRDVEAAYEAVRGHHNNSRQSLWPIIFPE